MGDGDGGWVAGGKEESSAEQSGDDNGGLRAIQDDGGKSVSRRAGAAGMAVARAEAEAEAEVEVEAEARKKWAVGSNRREMGPSKEE
jgi:hypothetical protein